MTRTGSDCAALRRERAVSGLVRKRIRPRRAGRRRGEWIMGRVFVVPFDCPQILQLVYRLRVHGTLIPDGRYWRRRIRGRRKIVSGVLNQVLRSQMHDAPNRSQRSHCHYRKEFHRSSVYHSQESNSSPSRKKNGTKGSSFRMRISGSEKQISNAFVAGRIVCRKSNWPRVYSETQVSRM